MLVVVVVGGDGGDGWWVVGGGGGGGLPRLRPTTWVEAARGHGPHDAVAWRLFVKQ